MARPKGPVKVKTEAEKAKDKAQRRARFETVGANRTGKVLVSLNALGKVANKRGYEFGDGDITEMTAAIREGVKQLEAKFNAALSATGGAVSGAPAFKFTGKK